METRTLRKTNSSANHCHVPQLANNTGKCANVNLTMCAVHHIEVAEWTAGQGFRNFDTRRPQQSPLTSGIYRAERTVGVSSAWLTGPAPVGRPIVSSTLLCSNLIKKLTN